jgi:hypothetical protein
VAEPEQEWEFASLEWIHRVREAEYQRTKDLPLEAWLKPADPQEAIRACRRLGLKVKVSTPETRERETTSS